MEGQSGNSGFNWKKNRRIATLIARYIQESLTPAEHDELDEWVGASDTNMRIFEELTDKKKAGQFFNWIKKIDQSVLLKKSTQLRKHHYLFSRSWYVVAVALFLVIIGVTTFLFYKMGVRQSSKISFKINSKPIHEDRVDTFSIISKSNVSHTTYNDSKNQGEPRKKYNKQKVNNEKIITEPLADNTLFETRDTPKGGTYFFTLAEGTMVFLNAASSITYPKEFNKKERRVIITGEVYFEVMEQDKWPFIVEVKDGYSLKAWTFGSRFNINAYRDDPTTKITSLKGSLKIDANTHIGFLRPGQQVLVNKAIVTINPDIDTSGVMIWRKGGLKFDGMDLVSIMKQIERQYGLDISYEFKYNLHKKYSCVFPNYTPVTSIFEFFSKFESIEFKREGRKVKISSQQTPIPKL